MSTNELGELWNATKAATNANADLKALVQTGFARIEAMLSERCEARMTRIQKIEKDVETNRKSIEAVQLDVRGLTVRLAVWTGIGSVVGGASVAALFRYLGG